MFSALSLIQARQHQQDLHAAAERRQAARPADETSTPATRVTLRYASQADRRRLHRLAELDSAQAPVGATLVAEVDGRLRAAVPLDGSRPIADPFYRGCELVELLLLRAKQLQA